MEAYGGRLRNRHIPVDTITPIIIWPSPPIFHIPLLKAIINPIVVIKSGVVLVSILRKLSVEPKLGARKKRRISARLLWISQLEIIKDRPRVITSALIM
jgi:hypothetical protein